MLFKRSSRKIQIQNGDIIRVRVQILVRAWAETLTAMFPARQDPAAVFWSDAYTKLRRSTIFPAVPVSATPYVCDLDAKPRLRDGGVLTAGGVPGSGGGGPESSGKTGLGGRSKTAGRTEFAREESKGEVGESPFHRQYTR
mmetsp:Transcript_12579/g.33339  ORF Transcript_12579/g.33339 Transcript_12579/m.33339 type:complete len:141 (+) Transcript_12579:1610-2032(+)